MARVLDVVLGLREDELAGRRRLQVLDTAVLIQHALMMWSVSRIQSTFLQSLSNAGAGLGSILATVSEDTEDTAYYFILS